MLKKQSSIVEIKAISSVAHPIAVPEDSTDVTEVLYVHEFILLFLSPLDTRKVVSRFD